MTLLEAIKTGRRFRRSGRQNWMEVQPNGLIAVEDFNYLTHAGPRRVSPQFTNHDITALDYEVDETYVHLSYSGFEMAWREVFGGLQDTNTGIFRLKEAETFKKFCNKLGLLK